MSTVKGTISVDVIDKQTANISIETLSARIVTAIINRLENYYIYKEQPYLDTSDDGSYVEITLHGVDENYDISDINWDREIDETIHDLARESLSPEE